MIDSNAIKRFLEDCDAIGIRNPARFLQGKFPKVFTHLRGAFPGNIIPTDIDGEVELNGKFLRLEYKHEAEIKSCSIPSGQLRCFEALIRTGYHTVFLVGHDDAGNTTCLHIMAGGGYADVFDQCDDAKLKQECNKWAMRVAPERTLKCN
jgi:hypothetical protein